MNGLIRQSENGNLTPVEERSIMLVYLSLVVFNMSFCLHFAPMLIYIYEIEGCCI